MTGFEILFLGGCLTFGVTFAIYARWSRSRLEREDRNHPAE